MQNIMSKLLEDLGPDKPIPAPSTTKVNCPRCRYAFDSLGESGLCSGCQSTVDQGFQISSLGGRCANGAERDQGTLFHARIIGADGTTSHRAACGAAPGSRSVGWSNWHPSEAGVTCQKCLKKLERVSADEFAPGEKVTWLQSHRGGYGYTTPVKAEVIRQTTKRVRIRVWGLDGGPVEKSVKPESLKKIDK